MPVQFRVSSLTLIVVCRTCSGGGQVEGMKRGRYWTFALVDPTGGSLLRMSTQNKPDGELWVSLFKKAGCTIEVRVVLCTSAAPPFARARSGNA